MEPLRGLGKLAFVLNPQDIDPWPLNIGKLMINMTSIELTTYQFLNELESTRERFNSHIGSKLSKRVTRIQSLITNKPDISPQERNYINGLWDEVKRLSRWRNRLAHNPVMFAWKPSSNSKTDPPDVVGVIDVEQLKTGSVSDTLTIEQLNSMINQSARVAGELNAVAAKIFSAKSS